MLGRRACLLAVLARPAWASDGLTEALAAIEARVGGRLGVAVLDAGGRVAGHRIDERFPMASTFKALLAAAILARVDAGEDRLDRTLPVTRADLLGWAPVTGPRVGTGMRLGELCAAVMTVSDNTAANLLLGTLGGPAGLTAWLRRTGDAVTRLDRTEPTLNEARPGDPRDTSTPAAMAATLHRLALGDVLAPASRRQLQDWLRANTTGGARLRAGVPAGWQVGDRTGLAAHGTSNVIGLLWPPHGAAPLVVAAFLTESPAEPAARDAALAEVAAALARLFRPRDP